MQEHIKSKLLTLTTKNGVYKMLDKDDKIIYIGKAKNLKNRVSSYFNSGRQNNKTINMINKVYSFQVIVVETEVKALILENELIKQHQPKYNILLKDSKTYPYIFISKDKHPRIGFYRGIKNNKNKYFGPYPSVGIIRNSLALLKKIFKIRDCTNNTYNSRSRACLEYQIGVCSAPCVNKISNKDYDEDVNNAINFLLGKSKKVLSKIEDKMKLQAEQQNFEIAAHYRDQMISLRKIQEQHNTSSNIDIDFIYIKQKENISCVQIIFVRDGKQIDNEALFPKNTLNHQENEILLAFLPLYYINRIVPKIIAINIDIKDSKLIEKTLSCKIVKRLNADKKHFMKIAELNAIENLNNFSISKNRKNQQLLKIKQILNMKVIPNHIECFDISHYAGEATVASCVVFKEGVPSKKNYRIFNIKGVTAGDDYGAMRQAIYRRYKNEENIPNLLLVDGGIGQLNQAIMVFDSIGITNCLLIGVAKGEGRKAGLETLVLKDNKKINLKPDDMALNLINFIRDESHRFAINKHRKKLIKIKKTSSLESIEGVGKKKREALLNYFGGIKEVQNAAINELVKVQGINNKIAINIIIFFEIKKTKNNF